MLLFIENHREIFFVSQGKIKSFWKNNEGQIIGDIATIKRSGERSGIVKGRRFSAKASDFLSQFSVFYSQNMIF